MKKIAIVIAGLFLVSGCATPEQGGSQGQNAAAGAGIGAVAGCGLAVMLGGRCADGAIVGGLAGAVVGWSYESKKVATAESVNTQARKEGVIVPKDKVVLGGYEVVPNTNSVKQGGSVVTNSTITLLGRSNTPPKVEEKLTLVTPEGKEGTPQIGKLAAVDGAGEYTSTGKFTIPKGFPQGKYTVKSQLFLDDKVAANKSFNVQVAYVDGNQVIHLASAE